MRRVILTAGWLTLAALAGLVGPGTFRAALPAAEGKTPPVFRLPDPAGKEWLLSDFTAGGKAVVVLFVGTQCPINNAYMPRLAELHRAYAEKGVRFVAINSNAHDTTARIAAHAKDHKIPFPVLKASANVGAAQFGPRRTPEVFVLTPDRRVAYQGRIDDQFGINYKRAPPTRRDLAEALDEILA